MLRGFIVTLVIIAIFIVWPFVWASQQKREPTRNTPTCPAAQTDWLGYCKNERTHK